MPRQLRFVILCSRRSCGNSSTGKVTDMKTKTRATIYAAALLLTIGAAAAQVADDVSGRDGQVTIRSVPVRYTVESLNHDEGKQALVARLESAARRIRLSRQSPCLVAGVSVADLPVPVRRERAQRRLLSRIHAANCFPVRMSAG